MEEALLNVITVGLPNTTQWENDLNALLQQYQPANVTLSPVEQFMDCIEMISEFDYSSPHDQKLIQLSTSQNLVTY